MIWEGIIGFLLEFTKRIFDFVAFIEVPIDMISVLTPILAYGNAIIGLDVIGIIFASFAFWAAVKISAGFALFIYHNIPFV
jgi:hypothetical protein